jgi:hypothetical protein
MCVRFVVCGVKKKPLLSNSKTKYSTFEVGTGSEISIKMFGSLL